MRSARERASSSPNTASPRRFRFSCSPDSAAFARVLLSLSDSASSTKWPTICRMRRRAKGITRLGKMGPKNPPIPTKSPLKRPKNAGSNFWVIALSASAATLSSSGRMTRSTKSMVKATPSSSRSKSASCSDDGSCSPSVAASHFRARWAAASMTDSTSSDSTKRECAAVVMRNFLYIETVDE